MKGEKLKEDSTEFLSMLSIAVILSTTIYPAAMSPAIAEAGWSWGGFLTAVAGVVLIGIGIAVEGLSFGLATPIAAALIFVGASLVAGGITEIVIEDSADWHKNPNDGLYNEQRGEENQKAAYSGDDYQLELMKKRLDEANWLQQNGKITDADIQKMKVKLQMAELREKYNISLYDENDLNNILKENDLSAYLKSKEIKDAGNKLNTLFFQTNPNRFKIKDYCEAISKPYLLCSNITQEENSTGNYTMACIYEDKECEENMTLGMNYHPRKAVIQTNANPYKIEDLIGTTELKNREIQPKGCSAIFLLDINSEDNKPQVNFDAVNYKEVNQSLVANAIKLAINAEVIAKLKQIKALENYPILSEENPDYSLLQLRSIQNFNSLTILPDTLTSAKSIPITAESALGTKENKTNYLVKTFYIYDSNQNPKAKVISYYPIITENGYKRLDTQQFTYAFINGAFNEQQSKDFLKFMREYNNKMGVDITYLGTSDLTETNFKSIDGRQIKINSLKLASKLKMDTQQKLVTDDLMVKLKQGAIGKQDILQLRAVYRSFDSLEVYFLDEKGSFFIENKLTTIDVMKELEERQKTIINTESKLPVYGYKKAILEFLKERNYNYKLINQERAFFYDGLEEGGRYHIEQLDQNLVKFHKEFDKQIQSEFQDWIKEEGYDGKIDKITGEIISSKDPIFDEKTGKIKLRNGEAKTNLFLEFLSEKFNDEVFQPNGLKTYIKSIKSGEIEFTKPNGEKANAVGVYYHDTGNIIIDVDKNSAVNNPKEMKYYEISEDGESYYSSYQDDIFEVIIALLHEMTHSTSNKQLWGDDPKLSRYWSKALDESEVDFWAKNVGVPELIKKAISKNPKLEDYYNQLLDTEVKWKSVESGKLEIKSMKLSDFVKQVYTQDLLEAMSTASNSGYHSEVSEFRTAYNWIAIKELESEGVTPTKDKIIERTNEVATRYIKARGGSELIKELEEAGVPEEKIMKIRMYVKAGTPETNYKLLELVKDASPEVYEKINPIQKALRLMSGQSTKEYYKKKVTNFDKALEKLKTNKVISLISKANEKISVLKQTSIAANNEETPQVKVDEYGTSGTSTAIKIKEAVLGARDITLRGGANSIGRALGTIGSRIVDNTWGPIVKPVIKVGKEAQRLIKSKITIDSGDEYTFETVETPEVPPEQIEAIASEEAAATSAEAGAEGAESTTSMSGANAAMIVLIAISVVVNSAEESYGDIGYWKYVDLFGDIGLATGWTVDQLVQAGIISRKVRDQMGASVVFGFTSWANPVGKGFTILFSGASDALSSLMGYHYTELKDSIMSTSDFKKELQKNPAKAEDELSFQIEQYLAKVNKDTGKYVMRECVSGWDKASDEVYSFSAYDEMNKIQQRINQCYKDPAKAKDIRQFSTSKINDLKKQLITEYCPAIKEAESGNAGGGMTKK